MRPSSWLSTQFFAGPSPSGRGALRGSSIRSRPWFSSVSSSMPSSKHHGEPGSMPGPRREPRRLLSRSPRSASGVGALAVVRGLLLAGARLRPVLPMGPSYVSLREWSLKPTYILSGTPRQREKSGDSGARVERRRSLAPEISIWTCWIDSCTRWRRPSGCLLRGRSARRGRLHGALEVVARQARSHSSRWRWISAWSAWSSSLSRKKNTRPRTAEQSGSDALVGAGRSCAGRSWVIASHPSWHWELPRSEAGRSRARSR